MEEIKAGQVWQSRNGKRWKIDQVLPNNWGNTPVQSGNYHWQKNGRYWDDKTNHSKDLIKLIQ